ncbi:MAG: AMP nucleosidase, partial [Phenylobacterium sp.]
MTPNADAVRICDALEAEYDASVTALRTALNDFLSGGVPPDPSLRASGAFAYPSLRLVWPSGLDYPRLARAYARLAAPGAYETTVTRPR